MLSFCIDLDWRAPDAIHEDATVQSILPADCWHYCTAIPKEGSAYASFLLERVAIPYGANVATKRAIEFACGRSCAALALRRAGGMEMAVPSAPDRRPLWPRGFVGSITHTDEFCWAAVMSGGTGRHIGIDSERILDVETAADVVPLAVSRSDVGRPTWLSFEEYVTVLFSAKESIYKAACSKYGYIRDFKEISIVGMTKSGFDWRIAGRSINEPFKEGSGHYVLRAGLCHSAVLLHHGTILQKRGGNVAVAN